MSIETREFEPELLHRTVYLRMKAIAFGLLRQSGVEYYDSSYTHDFSLQRVSPIKEGPYDELLDRVRVSYDYRPNYESLILHLTHKGIRGDVATYFCGTKLGVTVIDGDVRFAWIDSLVPFHKDRIPEAHPVFDAPADERADFVEWEHSFDVRHPLDGPTADLAIAEVYKIAENSPADF